MNFKSESIPPKHYITSPRPVPNQRQTRLQKAQARKEFQGLIAIAFPCEGLKQNLPHI
jgi:hypothetical protein